MDAFEQDGYWWLPGKDENKHFGKLSFSHEYGLVLGTLESFAFDGLEPGKPTSIGVSEHYPVIKGITRKGKYITLVDCDSSGLSISYPGFPSEKFSARYALEDSVPTMSDPTNFCKARIQFTYLPEWVGISGLRQHLYINEETKALKKLEVTYEPLSSIVVDLGHATISVLESYSSQSDLVKGTSIKPSVWLEIKSATSLSFEAWYSQFIVPLQDFLTLATCRPNAFTGLFLFVAKDEETEGVKALPRARSIRVFYRQSVAKKTGQARALWNHDMLFGLQDIKEEFPQILSSWLAKRKELDTTMDLFFAVTNSSGTYLENEFLNLAQALEVYHRRKFNNFVTPKSDYKAKKRAIIENVPEEYRQWLTQQLAYANQPKLYQRLYDLLQHTKEITSKLVLNSTLFAKKITDTRNFLTHFSRKTENVMDDEELFRATQSLSYLIQACLMLELGLSEERIVGLFERNQKFLFTASQIRQAHYWE